MWKWLRKLLHMDKAVPGEPIRPAAITLRFGDTMSSTGAVRMDQTIIGRVSIKDQWGNELFTPVNCTIVDPTVCSKVSSADGKTITFSPKAVGTSAINVATTNGKFVTGSLVVSAAAPGLPFIITLDFDPATP